MVADMSAEMFPDDALADDYSFTPSGESFVPSAEAMDIGMMPDFPTFDLSSISSTEESS